MGKGRRRGSKNKVSKQAKELVLEALDDLGGKQWLLDLAEREPRSFAAMVQKLVPTEVDAKVDHDVTISLNVGKRPQPAKVKVIDDGKTQEVPQLRSPEGRDEDVRVSQNPGSEALGETGREERRSDQPAPPMDLEPPDRRTVGVDENGATEADPGESVDTEMQGPEPTGRDPQNFQEIRDALSRLRASGVRDPEGD